jgi:hypothetical protein
MEDTATTQKSIASIKAHPSVKKSPIWARNKSPFWGMRAGPPRCYDEHIVKPIRPSSPPRISGSAFLLPAPRSYFPKVVTKIPEILARNGCRNA